MFTLKSVVRSILGENNYSFLIWHRSRFGLGPTLRFIPRLLLRPEAIRINSAYGSIWLRPGSRDQEIFEQTFGSEGTQTFASEGIIPTANGSTRFVIDAGAHIGLVSIVLARRFPRATVIAVEPNVENFAMLVRNTARFPNVRPIQAGLWGRESCLAIQNPTAGNWAFRVEESAQGGLPAITVDDLVKRFSFDRVDVLKLDIEGAEKNVLEHSSGWIERVDTLIIELHDRLVPGCTEALEHAIAGRGFVKALAGSNQVYRRPGTVTSIAGMA